MRPEPLPQIPEVPWYLSISFVVILLASLGPIGLPFLWLSPRFHWILKAFLTVSILVLTLGFIQIYPLLERHLNELVTVVRQAYPELAPYLPK